MRGYFGLAVLLGAFAFLTAQYSFWVAFGVMYFAGMMVVIGTAFAAKYMATKRLRSALAEEQPGYPEQQELIIAKKLRAA